MTILAELEKRVFAGNFLEGLRNYQDQYSKLLGCKIFPEAAFVSFLVKEIEENLSGSKAFAQIKVGHLAELPLEDRMESALKEDIGTLMSHVCSPRYLERYCKPSNAPPKCFKGAYGHTDIDALIVHNNEVCLVEYEKFFEQHCENLCKVYSFKKRGEPSYRFSCLLVSPIFTALNREEEGGKTSGFLQCQEYIIKSKEYWDKLLGKENWKMLGIVDLNTGQDCIRLLP